MGGVSRAVARYCPGSLWAQGRGEESSRARPLHRADPGAWASMTLPVVSGHGSPPSPL